MKDHFLFAKRVFNFILSNFQDKKLIFINTEEDLLILNLVKFYERKANYIVTLQISDDDYFRDSHIKKRKTTELLDKIYLPDYDEDQPRLIILRELFIFRGLTNKFTTVTIKKHFTRIL